MKIVFVIMVGIFCKTVYGYCDDDDEGVLDFPTHLEYEGDDWCHSDLIGEDVV